MAKPFDATTKHLMGLRYPREMVKRLLEGVKQMKESDTYQAILEEGEARGEARGVARGEVEGRRALLLRIGGKKFGPPGPSARSIILAISDSQKLESLAERVLDVSTWDDLLEPG